MRIETDPSEGTNYTITSTTQLSSVSDALNAKYAKSGLGGAWSDITLISVTLAGYCITDGNYPDRNGLEL